MSILILLIQIITGDGIGIKFAEPLDPGTAYAALLEIYSGDILKIKELKFHKLKSIFEMEKTIYSNSNIALFCSLPAKDQANLETVWRIQSNALSLVGPNIKTIFQVRNKLLSANPSEQLAIINKFIEGGRLVRNSDKVRNGFLPFCWQVTLLSFLDTCFVQIADEKKIEIIKSEILPFINEFKNEIGSDNLWVIDFQLYCKAMLCVLEPNFDVGFKTIEEFTITREKIFGNNHSCLAIPFYCKLSLLMKEKRYEEAIQNFKKIPQNWLDSSDDFQIHHRIKFAVIAADAYIKLNNKEMAILWREVAFSYSFTLSSLAGKNFSLHQSNLLRNLYIEGKSWGLMRNLEERCAKIGMKPLPKQEGEN